LEEETSRKTANDKTMTYPSARQRAFASDLHIIPTRARGYDPHTYDGHENRQRASHTNRVHRLRANGGNVSLDEWEELKALYHGCCAYCHQAAPLTQDHVIPISKGGWHVIENIVPACQPCNSRKGATTVQNAI